MVAGAEQEPVPGLEPDKLTEPKEGEGPDPYAGWSLEELDRYPLISQPRPEIREPRITTKISVAKVIAMIARALTQA
jgi:hypothetical protein